MSIFDFIDWHGWPFVAVICILGEWSFVAYYFLIKLKKATDDANEKASQALEVINMLKEKFGFTIKTPEIISPTKDGFIDPPKE